MAWTAPTFLSVLDPTVDAAFLKDRQMLARGGVVHHSCVTVNTLAKAILPRRDFAEFASV